VKRLAMKQPLSSSLIAKNVGMFKITEYTYIHQVDNVKRMKEQRLWSANNLSIMENIHSLLLLQPIIHTVFKASILSRHLFTRSNLILQHKEVPEVGPQLRLKLYQKRVS
jgi:hypothetical protein